VNISPSETVNLIPAQGSSPANEGAPLGTDTFALGVTSSCPIIGMPCETYTNASNSTIYGVAYLVLHNSLAQTVDISTALIVLSSGQELTVSMPIVGANGTASEFAVSVDQFAISTTAVANFQL